MTRRVVYLYKGGGYGMRKMEHVLKVGCVVSTMGIVSAKRHNKVFVDVTVSYPSWQKGAPGDEWNETVEMKRDDCEQEWSRVGRMVKIGVGTRRGYECRVCMVRGSVVV